MAAIVVHQTRQVLDFFAHIFFLASKPTYRQAFRELRFSDF
jgi:hypothetical protein